MKVLIVSDTHGRDDNLLLAIQKVSPIDLLVHLGDFNGGEESIKKAALCPTEFVSGNNDFFNGYPKEKIIDIGRYRVMLTHGHRQGVNSSTHTIREAASRNDVDIVMFGHTHVPMIDLKEDIWLVNPGSITLPRQNGRIPTYIIMDLDNSGEAHFTLNFIQA